MQFRPCWVRPQHWAVIARYESEILQVLPEDDCTSLAPTVSLAKNLCIPKLFGSFDYMKVPGLLPLLGLAPPAQPGQQQPPFWTSLVPLGLLVVVFYFVLIRPQQKKARQHTEMLKAVRAGDKIVTSGGVVGVVLSVKEKTLTIRSADAKFEVTKAAISEITERGGESSES